MVSGIDDENSVRKFIYITCGGIVLLFGGLGDVSSRGVSCERLFVIAVLILTRPGDPE